MPTTTQSPANPELDRETGPERDLRTADAQPARPDRAGQFGQFGQFGHDNTFLRHTKPASRRPR